MPGMTRSLHIIASKRPGGAEGFFVRLVDGLNADRPGSAEALVVAMSPIAQALGPGTAQHHLAMRGHWDPWARWRIPRIARRLGVPLVQTYLGRATRLTRLGGRGIVHVARVGGFYDPAQYAHADLCVVNARALADHLVRGGIPAGRVEVIGNFADPAPEVPEAELAALRRDLAIPPDAFVVAAIARLHPVKGLNVLLEAAAKARTTRPLVVVLVGDGPLRAELERQAAALGIAERVRFAGWQTRTAPWFQLADLIACPSRMEGFGNVVIEAWANHRPVLASTADGPAELIDDGVNGRLVPIGDAAALARAITELSDSPADLARLAEAGRASLQQNYTQGRIIARYRELYARLTGA